MGILAASKQIAFSDLAQYMIMGELSLDGNVQPIKGALPIAIKAKEEGLHPLFFLKKMLEKQPSLKA
jgi:magnesium chelatase family protein